MFLVEVLWLMLVEFVEFDRLFVGKLYREFMIFLKFRDVKLKLLLVFFLFSVYVEFFFKKRLIGFGGGSFFVYWVYVIKRFWYNVYCENY